MRRLFLIFLFMVNFLYAASDIIVDNHDSGFSITGTWPESGAPDEYAGSSRFSRTLNSSATWTPTLPEAGDYDVYVWYTGSTAYKWTQVSGPGIVTFGKAKLFVKIGRKAYGSL